MRNVARTSPTEPITFPKATQFPFVPLSFRPTEGEATDRMESRISATRRETRLRKHCRALPENRCADVFHHESERVIGGNLSTVSPMTNVASCFHNVNASPSPVRIDEADPVTAIRCCGAMSNEQRASARTEWFKATCAEVVRSTPVGPVTETTLSTENSTLSPMSINHK